jgi:hypothetical protein
MSHAVTLAPQFNSPALRAGLEVHLILARAWGEILDAGDQLESPQHSWMDILKVQGMLAAKDVPQYTGRQQIQSLWQSFLGNPRISKLPQASLELLEKARLRTLDLANMSQHDPDLLGEASDAGHRLIHDLLHQKGISVKRMSVAPVTVHYDPTGKSYCASANASTEEIRWAYQPSRPHLLYGLIICDYVFAHEYLSHLMLPNPYFDSNVRERWLVATLIHAVIKAVDKPRWKRLLWMAYHNEVLNYVRAEKEKNDPEGAISEALVGELVESAAADLYLGFPEQFWSLTKEIMECRDDREKAELITTILPDLDRLIPHLKSKIHKISDLHDLAEAL